MTPPWIHEAGGAALLEVLVQPRASRTCVAGVHDGRLKLKVAAPPVEGEANAAVVELLARTLGVRKADVSIARGETGKRKTVKVEGVTIAGVIAALTKE